MLRHVSNTDTVLHVRLNYWMISQISYLYNTSNAHIHAHIHENTRTDAPTYARTYKICNRTHTKQGLKHLSTK